MGRSKNTDFAPKRLKPSDLAVQVTPGMRRLPPKDRDAVVQRRQALEDRVATFGTHTRKRYLRNVLLAGIGMPIVSTVFASAGWDVALLQVPAAIVLAAIIALLRPSEYVTALLFLLAGMITLAAMDHLTIHPRSLLAIAGYYGLGMLAGIEDWLRRMDGE